jgi:hypothetical protein
MAYAALLPLMRETASADLFHHQPQPEAQHPKSIIERGLDARLASLGLGAWLLFRWIRPTRINSAHRDCVTGQKNVPDYRFAGDHASTNRIAELQL